MNIILQLHHIYVRPGWLPPVWKFTACMKQDLLCYFKIQLGCTRFAFPFLFAKESSHWTGIGDSYCSCQSVYNYTCAVELSIRTSLEQLIRYLWCLHSIQFDNNWTLETTKNTITRIENNFSCCFCQWNFILIFIKRIFKLCLYRKNNFLFKNLFNAFIMN